MKVTALMLAATLAVAACSPSQSTEPSEPIPALQNLNENKNEQRLLKMLRKSPESEGIPDVVLIASAHMTCDKFSKGMKGSAIHEELSKSLGFEVALLVMVGAVEWFCPEIGEALAG